MLTGVLAGRGKKTNRKKNKRQPKKTWCCHPFEEDPAEEDPLFKPPDSLHFQIGDDTRRCSALNSDFLPMSLGSLDLMNPTCRTREA